MHGWLVLFFCFSVSTVAAANVLDVFPSTLGGINGVLKLAAPQDTVQIHAGIYSYPENCDIRIQTQNLVLVGIDGPQNTVIDCGLQSRCVTVLGVNTTITGITFKNGKAPKTTTTTSATLNNAFPSNQQNLHLKRQSLLPRRYPKSFAMFSVQFLLSPRGRFEKKIILMRDQFHSNLERNNKEVKATGSNSDIRATTTDDSFGGCIAVLDGSTVNLRNIIVTGGQAMQGCGVGISGSQANIADSIFDRNGIASAANYSIVGGGGYFYNSIVLISNSSFTSNNISNNAGQWSGGGGLCFESCTSTFLIGPIIVSNNALQSNGKEYLYGGGIYFKYCNHISMLGPMLISFNAVRSAGGGSVYGGGVYFKTCLEISLIGPILVQSNTLQSTRSIYVISGGLGGYVCTNVSLIGPITISNNTLISIDYGDLYGGGMFWETCVNLLMIGPIAISNNTILSVGSGDALGGGLFVETTKFSTIIGPMSITNNSLISTGSENLNMAGGGGAWYHCTNMSLIGPIAISSNKIRAAGNGEVFGGGMNWESCSSTTLVGPISVSYNTIQSTARDRLKGGGLDWEICSYTSLIGPISVSFNTLQCTGNGGLFGGGICWEVCPYTSLIGPVSITNNLLILSWNVDAPDASGFYTTPMPQSGPRCSSATISNMAGSLDDGSFNQSYSSNLYCTWLLNPSKNVQFSYVYNISFSNFDTEKGFDFLYIYDGSTSTSPLIGQYSGNLVETICSNGLCPSLLSPLITSFGALFLVFTSDFATEFSGFTMNWNMVPIDRSTGLTASLSNNLNEYPALAAGAGLIFAFSNGNIMNITVANNSVTSNAGLSIGGGIYLDSCSDGIVMQLSSIHQNTVSGFHAAGAGIAATKNSQLTIIKCELMDNAAIAQYDKCLYFTSKVICPSVFGGNVLVAAKSRVSIRSSIFNRGLCSCNTNNAMCSAVGGSIAVVHINSAMSISDSTCQSSVLMSSLPNNVNGGGFLFVQDAYAIVSSATTVSNNTVFGAAFGGGIYCTGSSVVSLIDSSISSNTAKQGGAVAISDTSAVEIRNCILSKNSGSSVGGALFMKGESQLAAFNTSFLNNIAGRASTVYSFNDNDNALYNISNSIGIVPIGSSIVMLGGLNLMSTVWNCSQPGTVFVQDLTSEFFSLVCTACGAGSYAVDYASTSFVDRTCQTCPFGARCLGSTSTSNGLYALSSFWGLNKNGSVGFHQCPDGYCCGLNDQNCVYDYCDGNRTGLLCGQCANGYGMRFFVEGCKSNDSCNDGVWFAWIIIMLAFVAVIALLMTTGGTHKSGMLSVLLYYYQVLPLIKSTPWKYSSGLIITGIQSIFSFSPNGSSSSSNGVCLVRNMTTSQKIGSKMLLQGVICSAIVVTYIVHVLLSKISLLRLDRPPISHYVATWIRFCTIAYTTLVLVPLQMIQCVDIDEHVNVWWWDASIECYQGWQKAGFAAIGILSPLPLFVIWVLWKKWNGDEDILKSKWKESVFRVLSGSYRTEKRWWLGVSLYRRLLMVVVYSTIKDLNWKAMASSGLCVIFVVMNHVMKPFRYDTTHRFESISLLLLCMISITSSPQLSQIQFGTTESIYDEMSLEWIEFAIGIMPLILYLILSGRRALELALIKLGKKQKANGKVGWIGDDIEDECDVCRARMNANEEWPCCENHQYC